MNERGSARGNKWEMEKSGPARNHEEDKERNKGR